MSSSQSRLIVVSNRLPFTLRRSEAGVLQRQPAAGGLVTAVAPVVISSRGVWVGWVGANVEEGSDIPEPDPSDASPTSGLPSSQVVPVFFNNEVTIITFK